MTTAEQTWSARTFGNEDQLPRVPLPRLEDTCDRFVSWCAPLLTADELAVTEAATHEFARPNGAGRALHTALAAYDSGDGVHSWLDTFWPARYLGRRDRIALNANFFFRFAVGPGPWLERAAALTAAAVAYKLRLDAETIPPVTLRGRPLSMDQNKFLFSTTRIPGLEQDTVRAPYTASRPGPSAARHIVVFCRGTMFRLDVLAPDGRPYPRRDLVAALHAATAAAQSRPDAPAGHLTTMARADWARTRAAVLACDPANAQVFDMIESALFCLCLEEQAPASELEACDRLLHGDSGNRWFDKSVSLIVFGDGTAGVNIEHCGLDGTTVLSFVDTLLATPDQEPSGPPVGQPALTPVAFVLDDALAATVTGAAAAFDEFRAATASTLVSFDDFGAAAAKGLGVSPDAFVQMAYQLAHNRAKGRLGATYESIATRHFRHGRTEAMRVVTPEALSFVAAMDDPLVDAVTRRARLRAAAAKHAERARECQAGQAPEQHLWEMLLIQRRRGAELGVPSEPDLYRSPGWLIMRDDWLSTSSAPSASISYFGFGSTASRCIGVAYVLLPDRFHLYLSTPRAEADGMTAFAAELRRAVPELRALLATGD